MKSLIIAGCLLLSTVSLAKKLVILTDEPSGNKANQIQALIKQTPPFSLLKKSEFTIEVRILDAKSTPVQCQPLVVKYTKEEIISLEYYAKQAGIIITPEEKKKYKEGYTINRLVQCDKGALAAFAIQFGADSMIFVRNSPYEGGSGGDIPVILSGSREGVGLHEWLHSFGLADEYPYPKQEAPIFCQGKTWVNVAIFNDQPPYASSEDVRIRHRDQILWLPYLSREAPLITKDQLGSPKPGQLGIFPAKTCEAAPSVKAWKPSSYQTIMENTQTNYIPKPYWTAILSGLGVSSSRITALLATEVTPTWLREQTSPGNPPAASPKKDGPSPAPLGNQESMQKDL